MSRLKISDLSFCETEISSDSQVQGGLVITFDSRNLGTSLLFQTPATVSNVSNVSNVSKSVYTDNSGNFTSYAETGTLTDSFGNSGIFSLSSARKVAS